MTPTIVAMGGGGFSMEPDNPKLDDYVLALAGTTRPPRVCFVPTASGDAEGYSARFLDAFAAPRAQPTVLSLFRRERADLRRQLLEQDVLYVGGGNTANALAIWRVHGVDVLLREAWERGVVLCGLSAGSICWFDYGLTDSFGPDLAPLPGLGLLPGSNCPHYDGEAERRPRFQALIAQGALPAGHAADDGVALRFEGQRLAEVVSSRPQAGAYFVSARAGEVREEPLAVRRL